MEILALLILFLGIYFIPTMVAYGRSHNNALAIVVLNLFLGWTLLGWIVATTWACTDNVRAVQHYTKENPIVDKVIVSE